MSLTPLSPINRLIHPERALSKDLSDATRKRVCKACDRCRLKKTKCDGSSPCSRCKADNAICAFGERKKSQNRVYPKGYVEVLEQQQTQLVSGLREMYYRLQKASAWDGAPLDESSGHPLTHDILSALGLQESERDDSGELEVFEENCEKLQSRMVSGSPGFIYTKGSLSSKSERSPHDLPRTASSRHDKQPKLQPHAVRLSVGPSTLQSPTFSNDPQLYAPEWAQSSVDMSDPDQPFRNNYTMQAGEFHEFNFWDPSQDHTESYGQFHSYQNQIGSGNVFGPNGLSDISDLGLLDAMEVDYSEFVRQPEVMT